VKTKKRQQENCVRISKILVKISDVINKKSTKEMKVLADLFNVFTDQQSKLSNCLHNRTQCLKRVILTLPIIPSIAAQLGTVLSALSGISHCWRPLYKEL